MNRALFFALAVVGLIIAAWVLPLADWFQLMFAWIEANRSYSWSVFILVYVLATVFMLPGSLLTLAAGFLFGLGYGFAIVSFASVTGATCAFLVGRFFARDWVESKLAGMPRFAALDKAIAARGWLVVLLTRLSPLFPFNLLNYALGRTSVRLAQYMLLSWIGMMPGTVLYVYLGSVASSLSAVVSGDVGDSPIGSWLFYLGLVATLILTIFITRLATRALNTELDKSGGEQEARPS